MHYTESDNKALLVVRLDPPEQPLPIKLFSNEGFQVELLQSTESLADKIEKLEPDLILIDCATPTLDNFSRCRQLRIRFSGPILFLSEQIDDTLQVLGLESGIDDFIFKPLPPSLLLAKIRAILRRDQHLPRHQKQLARLGDLVVDAGRREVHAAGRRCELTTREFDLLWCLMENARTILSREKLHQVVFHTQYNGFERSIDIYISRIRRKIGDDPLQPRRLKTVRGAGYLLTDTDPA